MGEHQCLCDDYKVATSTGRSRKGKGHTLLVYGPVWQTSRKGFDSLVIHVTVQLPIPCFICGKELESAFTHDDDQRQPYGATQFSTYGQYGSTVFDEIGRSQLLINICDEHLLANKERVYHVAYTRQSPVEDFYRPWEPYQD